MKRILFSLLAFLTLPNVVHSSHLYNQKKLIVTSESSRESIELAKYLNDNGVVKYSAYWCPNCLHQSELFGKQAYRELNVVECARDGINSQTQLCIDKKIKGFPTWEINGKLRPGIVHGLDKDTSGCMVVAKSQEALVNLQKQIKEKIASREYIAVIHGAPNSEEGQIVGHIGRDKFNRLKYKVVEEASGRYACTFWKLKERLGNYSLLNFKLDTGRTHQIRVHCAHINHPIVGDPLYGRCKKLPCKLEGQALHAIKLGLIHPINGKEMIFEAELPLDFQKLLNVLKIK